MRAQSFPQGIALLAALIPLFPTSTPAQCLVPGSYGSGTLAFYECAFGNYVLNVSTWIFEDLGGGQIRVSGLPGLNTVMLGSIDCQDSTFSVSAMVPGTCNEFYTLSGTIISETEWSGVFAVDFSGGCLDCVAQNWIVDGTLAVVGTDLSLMKSGPAGPVTCGDPLTYVLTVTNEGQSAALDVVVTDDLPVGVSYVSGNSSQGTVSETNGTVTGDLGMLLSGASATVTIEAVLSELVLPNRAEVTATNADPDTSNNVAILLTEVECATVSAVGMAAGAAGRTWLEPTHPNPFRPETGVRFSLAEGGHVQLRVFDVQGRLVTELVDGPLAAGEHQADWNGTRDGGARVAAGVYFVELRVDGQRRGTRKAVALR